jgi:hypothetical protein
MARMQLFTSIHLGAVSQRGDASKLRATAKRLCDVCILSLSRIYRVASAALAALYQKYEDNALEPFNDDATRTRLDQLLIDEGFLACLSADELDEFLAVWGLLHRQADRDRFFAAHGL